MPKFDKIEELLGELYRHRKLLSALFDKRMTVVDAEMLLPFLDDDHEKLERLADYELLYWDKSHISLNGRLQEFFEEFLEVDETVHVLYIQENLDKIREFQSYYLKEHNSGRKDEYLLKIKNHLRRIIRTTLMNVKTLRTNTDDTYKSETNFEIKREKLNNIREQRDGLEGVLKAVEKLLDDELFFRTAADDELLLIVHHLRVALHESYHNLIEIQQQIIEYLNHIEKRVEVVEKVIRLKALRDKHYLKEQTNIYDLVARIEDLPVKRNEPVRTRLSVRKMSDREEMHQLIFKVREKLKNFQLLQQNVAGEITSEALKNQEAYENIVNLPLLKNIFMGKQLDLFAFILHHDFSKEVSESERIKLYCRLASLYEADLNFTEDTAHWNGLEYALIYPKSNPLNNK